MPHIVHLKKSQLFSTDCSCFVMTVCSNSHAPLEKIATFSTSKWDGADSGLLEEWTEDFEALFKLLSALPLGLLM